MNILKNAHRLPVLDWNLNFFGGHSQKVDDTWIVPLNKHQAFELIFVVNGQEIVNFEHDSYLLNSGDFVLIPPGFIHTVSALKNLTYFCFHFDIDDPSFVVGLIQNSPIYFPEDSSVNQEITPIIEDMNKMISSKVYSFEDKMNLQIYLSKMLLKFNSLINKQPTVIGSSQSKYAKTISEMIKNEFNDHVLYFATRFLNGPDNQKIQVPEMPTIKHIMEATGISVGYGNRVFRSVYCLSPCDYLSKLKLKWAQQMLAKPQYNIDEIALVLGYSDSTHFSRQFKRWTGVSPKKYR
ncbi:AraC family transcriptional regulator [Oenococcus oeni]|uniref:AraC family transcriptional regulator n=1 Tax=Oenococcus oeni TaxID=1247 RepID=UPI003EE64148